MTIRVLAIALAVCAAGPLAAEQIYKWKDASGATVFSKTPPPEGEESEQLTLRQPPPVPAPPEENAAGPAAERAAACEAARQNLDTLRDNPVVEVQQADGSRRTLGTDEREVMRAAEEKRVEMFCGDDAAEP